MTRCLSPDALVDLLLDGRDASAEDAAHVEVCPRCRAELTALQAVVQALEGARRVSVPEEWTERILARVRQEPEPPRRLPWVVAHSFRTLGLAFLTVLAAVFMFAPGGVGSPKGLFGYALSVGAAAAGMEVLRRGKPDRWKVG